MEIRSLTESDLDSIISIHLDFFRCIKDVVEEPYFDKVTLDEESIRDFYVKSLTSQDYITYIALDKEIWGFISGYISKPFITLSGIEHVGFISASYVKESKRRQGIMKQLEHKICCSFKERNLKYIELTILTKNDEARKCWHALGYAPFREHFRKSIDC